MVVKIYKDDEADSETIKNEVVGIIGYGIQGRNQALNLRESGVNVLVYNRKDKYYDQAIEDGFEVLSIEEVVKNSTILLFLIPDQAQKDVFNNHIRPHVKSGTMLVVAAGYSIRFNQIKDLEGLDVVLLAPRFPGQVIRKNYLEGKGTLAFFDVHQDFTGNAEKRGLSLAKAIGLTKAGLMKVSLVEEAEVDLFIEQFLIPSYLNTIQSGFDLLVRRGYTPEVAMLELFSSEEIIGLLSEGTRGGLYETFQTHTSPTCQFGVKESFNKIITSQTQATAEDVLNNILSGDFTNRLERENDTGYLTLKRFNESNNVNNFSKTFKELMRRIKQNDESRD